MEVDCYFAWFSFTSITERFTLLLNSGYRQFNYFYRRESSEVLTPVS